MPTLLIQTIFVKQQGGKIHPLYPFDALQSAKSRMIDYVIVDIVGRLQVKHNLMIELAKLARIAKREVSGAPLRMLLVIDTATGQDGEYVVNGTALGKLKQFEISVPSGVHEDVAPRANEAFITIRTEHPAFGTLKAAMTLRGKIATRDGESKWITSLESRGQVQKLRHAADAIVTGRLPKLPLEKYFSCGDYRRGT